MKTYKQEYLSAVKLRESKVFALGNHKVITRTFHTKDGVEIQRTTKRTTDGGRVRYYCINSACLDFRIVCKSKVVNEAITKVLSKGGRITCRRCNCATLKTFENFRKVIVER